MGKVIPFPNDRPEPSAEVYACKCLCVSWFLKGNGEIACAACGAICTDMLTYRPSQGLPAA